MQLKGNECKKKLLGREHYLEIDRLMDETMT